MNWNTLNLLFAMATPPAPGTQADPKAEMLKSLGMLIFIFAIFYLMAIRPQQKRAKEHAKLLNSLKPGDKVTTGGGIVGVVLSVKDKTAMLRTADAKIEVLKTAVTEITERGGDSGASN